MKILDTDVLAALLRKKGEAVQKIKEMKKSKEIPLTTVFNVKELLFGALISENYEENFGVCKELIESLDLLAYDKESMLQSVKVQVHLERKGQHRIVE
jgi:predicted nucleic acid-binding protein